MNRTTPTVLLALCRDAAAAVTRAVAKRTTLTALLASLAMVTVARAVWIEWTPGPLDRCDIVRGRDFQIFYIAGWLIANGEADRLYDHQRVQEIQETISPIDEELNPPYFLFYPPLAPLCVAPLALLPYPQALNVWWLSQVGCFFAVGWLLRKDVAAFAPEWRSMVWLALLALYPICATIVAGQLSAVLLLVLAVGFELQRRGRPVSAGVALSLLAMKPHFFVGIFLWLVLRRDWRTLAAMTAGLAMQCAAVAAILGPGVLTAYIGYLPVCAAISQIFKFAPWAEHGPAGVVQNFLLWFDCPATLGKMIGRFVQLFVVAGAGWWLYRIAAAARAAASTTATGADSNRATRAPAGVESSLVQEQSAAVLFMLLLTPHVLTYDLVLLAAPLVHLWSSARWRLGVVLYAATSVLAVPVYNIIGFSLVPIILLVTLSGLARPLAPARLATAN